LSDERQDLSPYEQGFNAEAQGLSEKDCPYQAGTPEHARWLEGYRDAAEEEDHE
jgi:ribosome modulation factor